MIILISSMWHLLQEIIHKCELGASKHCPLQTVAHQKIKHYNQKKCLSRILVSLWVYSRNNLLRTIMMIRCFVVVFCGAMMMKVNQGRPLS